MKSAIAVGVSSVSVSKAAEAFEVSIKDAEELLSQYEKNGQPPPQNAEVLQRAGLVMALTAWETYVEDRIAEAVNTHFGTDTSLPAKFLQAKLAEELKRFHNPTSDKTRKLFEDYLGIDVSAHWRWSNVEPIDACKKLDTWLAKRGDAVHRSRPHHAGSPQPHLVKKEELEKAIRFIRELMLATERALQPARA